MSWTQINRTDALDIAYVIAFGCAVTAIILLSLLCFGIL